MQVETQTRRFYLNSSAGTKLNGDANSKLGFSLPTLMPPRQEGLLYCKVKISNCQFPYSYYAVDEKSDQLVLNNVSYHLVHGNYNAYTMTQALNAIISPQVSVNFNQSTGKLTFTSPTNMTISASSTLSRILGIGVSDLTGTSITLPRQVNMIPTKVLYIKIPELKLDTYSVASGDGCTILAVPISAAPGEMIEKDNSSAEGYNTDLSGMNSLTMEIYDDQNKLMNFNGQDWTVSLQVDCYYQFIYRPPLSIGEVLQAQINAAEQRNKNLETRIISNST